MSNPMGPVPFDGHIFQVDLSRLGAIPPPPFRTATVKFRGFEPGTWDAIFLVECQGQWSCHVTIPFPELLAMTRLEDQRSMEALLWRLQAILEEEGIGPERGMRLSWHPETRAKFFSGRPALLMLVGDIRIEWRTNPENYVQRRRMLWSFWPVYKKIKVERHITLTELARAVDVEALKLHHLQDMVSEIQQFQDDDLRLRLLTGDEVGEEKRAWAKEALQLAFDTLLRDLGCTSLNDQHSRGPLRAQEIADMLRQIGGNNSQASAHMDLDETIAVLELAGWKLGDMNEFLEIQGYPEVTEGAGMVFLPTKQHRLCWESPGKFTQRVKGGTE